MSDFEFRVSQSFLNMVTSLRNIYFALVAIAFAVFFYLILEAQLSKFSLVLSVISAAVLGTAGFLHKYRKSIAAKKILISEDGIKTAETLLSWKSMNAASVSFYNTILIQDVDGKSLKVESTYKHYNDLFSLLMENLKTNVDFKQIRNIRKKARYERAAGVFVPFLFIDLIFLAISGSELQIEIYTINGVVLGLLLVYWLWPKITRFEINDSQFSIYTQYGARRRCSLAELEEVKFICFQDPEHHSYQLSGEISFATKNQLRFSMDGWDYMDLLSLFESHNIQVNIDSSAASKSEVQNVREKHRMLGATILWYIGLAGAFVPVVIIIQQYSLGLNIFHWKFLMMAVVGWTCLTGIPWHTYWRIMGKWTPFHKDK
jgi:hypothetical protein